MTLELGRERTAVALERGAQLGGEPLERRAQRRPPPLVQPALRRGATAALGAPALHPVGAAPRAGRDEPDVLLRLLPGEKSAKALDPDVAAPSQGFEHAGKDGVAVLVM